MTTKTSAPFVPPWIAPTFTDTWADYGAPYEVTGYMRTPDQIVHLQGLIKSGTIGNSAFTLPAGYRPANDHLFAVVSNAAFGAVEVRSSGVVVPVVGNTASVSLAGITFRAAP